MDYLEIGPSPALEECAQVGSDDYANRTRKECRAFINQLRRTFGLEPAGAKLFIKANPHDFGTYYEVACRFEDEASQEYAIKLENEMPERWDAEAKTELMEGVMS